MSRISRKAADVLKETVQKVKGLPPKGAGFADPGLPIRLAKTTEFHAAGTTKDVTLQWGDAGAETAGTTRRDTVPAYNRIGDIEADDWVYITRIGPRWEILPRTAPADASRCGVCSQVGGLVVPITGDVDATEVYTFSPACDGSLFITFTHDTSLTWLGTADSLLLDCGGETPRTLAPTMVVTNLLPDGVEILLPDGTGNVAVYHNIAAWQPCVPARFRLDDYDDTCPCVPWDQFACLTPVDGN